MNSAGFLYNRGVQTFRLCVKNSSENQFSFEIKKQFSFSSNFSSREKCCTPGNFSVTTLFDRCNRSRLLQNLRSRCNEKLSVLSEIFMQQFNFYASQRLRRASQIWHLYTRLYTEKSIKHIVSQFVRSLPGRRSRQFTVLLGAALFSWEKEKITDEEIESSISELDSLHTHDQSSTQLRTINDSTFPDKLKAEGWEAVIQKETCQLWRKSFPHSYLYEYKIFGTFFDVPARAFFSIQTDIEYRKKWDKLVIKLDVIDKENDGNCEVVHWVMHYPCPMYSREYVYIRRCMIDPKTNTMVLVSRAVDHPSCPQNNKYVRVNKYSSKMVIRPHTTFDENGFDYILTYFDDPQAAFPSAAYNWMASSGVPDFVERLHEAARELHYQQKRNKSNVAQSVSSNQCPANEVEYAYM